LACDQLGVPKDRFPYQTRPTDDGSPHVEISNDHYDFVVTERGRELERRSTQDADELLYWLLESVTFTLAGDFEVNHRVPGQDCRRLLFAKQVELLQGLDPAWGQRRMREHDRILHEHPFRDSIEA
jgi:hypothetical protein